jgi:hypothetical protein
MRKISAFFTFLVIALIQKATLGCFLYDIDYKGTNLNAEHSMRTEDAATCQKLCQNEPRCYFWTWATTDFFDVNYRKDCYLKAENVVMANENGLISGPKNCGRGKFGREKFFWVLSDRAKYFDKEKI